MNNLHLRKKDFLIEWFSGSGSGGQHRNRHPNCCRITHKGTGIKAQSTEHKERSANQKVAFRVLCGRLMAHYFPSQKPEINTTIIRTYNEKQNRVKDHASGFEQPYDVVVHGRYLHTMIRARREATTCE